MRIATEEEAVEVEALISGWRDGKFGPYAPASILTPGAPAAEAMCNKSVKGLEAPLGSPFRCLIKPKANGKGYGVVELLNDGLSDSITNVAATVGERKHFDWLVRAALPDDYTLTITLPGKLMNSRQLAAIPPGYPVEIDAARDEAGYVATALHGPSAANVLDPASSPITLVCSILSGWSASQAKPSGAYASVAAESGLVAKLWVDASLLRAAGIATLAVTADDDRSDVEGDLEAVQEWEQVLREGDELARAELDIDVLVLTLEWVDATQQWRVGRLVAPRSVREPRCEGEILDWVHGQASGPVVTAAKKRAAAPAEEDGSAPPATTSYEYIMIDYDDVRLGRGSVRLFGAERIKAAGLTDGVPVVMSLVGKGQFWHIRALHRSTPHCDEDRA